MIPQAPNDYYVEFVDQLAAEELKNETKSKPALAGGFPLAEGDRLGNDTTSQRELDVAEKKLLQRDRGSSAKLSDLS